MNKQRREQDALGDFLDTPDGNAIKIVQVTTAEELNALYEQSALTWEGLKAEKHTLRVAEIWIREHDAAGPDLNFHIIKGGLMNEVYQLTGNNAYPENLTLVAVTGVDQIKHAIPRMQVGGRWFDDIVDNNARREEGGQ